MRRFYKPLMSRRLRSSTSQGKAPRELRRRLGVEPLECRRLLATVTVVDGDLVVTENSELSVNVAIFADAATQRYEITSVVPGPATDYVPFADVTGMVRAELLGGDDSLSVRGQFPVSVSVLSSGEIVFQQSVIMAADKDFTAVSTSTTQRILFTTAEADIVTSGTGKILLDAARSIQMGQTGSSLSTENGGITLLGNLDGTMATSAPAIETTVATITSTGTGNILIHGRGFGAAAGHDAVRVGNVQSLSSTNSSERGTITILGEEGLIGVQLGGLIPGAVTSNSGGITIVGQGGNVSTAHEVYGVGVGESVFANNGASISITGTGGSSASNADGIVVIGALQSQNGSITLEGTGGQERAPSGNGARGVAITGSSSPRVSSTSGPIVVEGIGGSGISDDYGVEILATGASAAVAAGGPLSITAIGGAGPNSFGVVVNATQTQLAISGSSSLNLTTDSIARGIRGRIDLAGAVTFVPLTPGLPITLGGDDVLTGTRRLGLSNTELFGIYAPTIVIGDADSGQITVDAAITPDANRSRNMELITGGDIVFNANLATVGSFSGMTPATGSLVLSPGLTGGVRPLAIPTDATTLSGVHQFPTLFAPGSDLEIRIEGTTANSLYDQFRVVGAIDVAGADLALSGGYVSTLGNVFTIVSADSVTGQFNGLTENCSFVHNGRSLRVNYTATTMTLTDVGQPPSIDVDAAVISTSEGSAATNAGTFNDPDGNATATVTASIGTVAQDSALGTWVWSIGTTDGPDGPIEVTITVTDQWCASDTVTFEYTVENLPPALTNAGAVTVGEGQTATNSGAWHDPGGDAVTMTASIGTVTQNGDGTWSWSFGASDGPDQSQTVTITAADSDGATSMTMFSLTVENVPPALTISGAASVNAGATYTLNLSSSDPGADTITSWTIDWGDGNTETVSGNPASVTHVFANGGNYSISATATDEDGAFASNTIAVSVAETAPGQGVTLIGGVLLINGSDANDIVIITKIGPSITVLATFADSNPMIFRESSISEIQVQMFGGHDIVVTTPNVVKLMTIDGGSGNDLLTGGGGRSVILGGSGHDTLDGSAGDDVLMGGAGNDVLLGGNGNDALVGGEGNDILDGGAGRDVAIGSQGRDLLNGGNDDDVLVGGYALHDDNVAALDAIMAIWSTSASFNSRVAALTGVGGLLQVGAAVFDDDDSDTILGGAERDLVFGDTSLSDGAVDLISLQPLLDTLVAVN